jgi:HD-like signal output (HDOD) protein
MAALTVADPRQRAADAVRQLNSVATLPEVMGQIMAMVENPTTTPAELKRVISHDPALVARILKVVNSSFYSLAAPVNAIDRAIVMLGLKAVKNITVAASMGQLFRGVKLCGNFTARDVWKHCVAVAVTSRELAKRIEPPLAEEAFLAGMIHDVGMLVSLQLWPEKLRLVCETALQQTSATPSFCDIEREQLGVDHLQLGLALAQQWKFPAACAAVAGYHHAAVAGEAPAEFAGLVDMVQSADAICCRSKHGFNLTARFETAEGPGCNVETAREVGRKLDELMLAASPLL